MRKTVKYNVKRHKSRLVRDKKVFTDYYRLILNGFEDPLARKLCEEYYVLSYYLVSRAIDTGLQNKWHLKIKK